MRLQPIDVPEPGETSGPAALEPKGFITDEEGLAMARAALALFARWGLVDAQARVLLGGIGQTTLTRWKRDDFGRLGTDTKTRLSLLMGVHAELRTLFIETDRAYRWVKAPNDELGGLRPLDVMLRGQIGDLQRVRDYLGALVRGGW